MGTTELSRFHWLRKGRAIIELKCNRKMNKRTNNMQSTPEINILHAKQKWYYSFNCLQVWEKSTDHESICYYPSNSQKRHWLGKSVHTTGLEGWSWDQDIGLRIKRSVCIIQMGFRLRTAPRSPEFLLPLASCGWSASILHFKNEDNDAFSVCITQIHEGI